MFNSHSYPHGTKFGQVIPRLREHQAKKKKKKKIQRASAPAEQKEVVSGGVARC